MKAFLTGATGFLGRHLLAHLLAEGDDVTALARTFEQARALPEAARVRPGDVAQIDSMRAAARGAEVIYHLAATRALSAAPKEAQRLSRVNVEGTRHVLQLAAEYGARRVVYVSDLMLYGGARPALIAEDALPPKGAATSDYQRTKQQAHFEIVPQFQAQNVDVLVLCPGAMFGPGDPSWVGVIAQRMAQHRAWFGVDDGLPRQWAHVDDVARGLRLAAERGQRNAAYFLAGEQATIPHWFGHAHRASGLPSPTIWIPYAALNALVHLIRRLFPRWVARVPFLPAPTPNALTTRAERELGWRAQPLGEALRDLGQWGNV